MRRNAVAPEMQAVAAELLRVGWAWPEKNTITRLNGGCIVSLHWFLLMCVELMFGYGSRKTCAEAAPAE